MYGETAVELLRELKRTAVHLLPWYNEDRINHVVDETQALYEEVQRTIEEHGSAGSSGRSLQDPSVSASLVVQYASIQRNKRVVLAYLQNRLDRVRAARWETGGVPPQTIRDNLSQNEKMYFREYSKLINEHSSALGINLAMDMQPPKELLIEVRCVKDFGEIQTENGPVNLQKNSQHLLLRTDVEQLIRQGVLEHVGEA